MVSSKVIVESILVKLNASEALVDDRGFAVCCKNVMISVRRAYMKIEKCCIVKRDTVICGRTFNQGSMAIETSPRPSTKWSRDLLVIPRDPGPWCNLCRP